MDNYVLDHDFGYGKEKETKELTKLSLRDVNDVRVYVLDVIENDFFQYSVAEKIKISEIGE